MDVIKEDHEEVNGEAKPSEASNSRRQHQQLRFASEQVQEHEQDKPKEKRRFSFKAVSRATRFLSIIDSSNHLPGTSLFRLRQLHSHATRDANATALELTDEELDRMAFKIEIITERPSNFDRKPSLRTKGHQHPKDTLDMSKALQSTLSDERRLEIIEEVLKNFNKENVLDEIRQTNAIPFQLPRTNQLQKNVAERIRDLTGSETIVLNDPIYMKNLCKCIEEEYKRKLEEKHRLSEINEKHRQLLNTISHQN